MHRCHILILTFLEVVLLNFDFIILNINLSFKLSSYASTCNLSSSWMSSNLVEGLRNLRIHGGWFQLLYLLIVVPWLDFTWIRASFVFIRWLDELLDFLIGAWWHRCWLVDSIGRLWILDNRSLKLFSLDKIKISAVNLPMESSLRGRLKQLHEILWIWILTNLA